MSHCSKSLKSLSFLQKLKEKKEILFGKFSDTLNREKKQAEWEELRQFCIAIGYITNDKDFVFVRNNTWGNLRKKTLKKIDAGKKTGGEGSPEYKLDELDLLVMDILGHDSPTVQGLGVPDSFTAGPNSTVGVEDEQCGDVEDAGGQSSSSFLDLQPDKLQQRMEGIRKKCGSSFKFNKKRPVPESIFNEIEALKKKKLALEVENLAMDLYLKEASVNMPPSPFTEHLHKRRPVEVLHVVENYDN